jgi:hypothetical protein
VLRGRAVRLTPLILLVADYGPGDLGFAQVVQRLTLAAPDARVCSTRVARADTLAAGLCVAALALGDGPRDRVVVHDVAGPARDRRLWIGRCGDGTLVVGADRGWAWSFIAPRATGICTLDLPADTDVALGVRRALTRHPHAVCTVIDRATVPPPPECVLVWTDRAGNLQTTLAAAPAERVMVRIGDRREPARLGDGRRAAPAGELVLEPGTRGLQRLTVAGGSAAERFGDPVAGTPVEITAGRDGAARGARRPSRRAAARRA